MKRLIFLLFLSSPALSEWSLDGGRFLLHFVRDVCQSEVTRCETINPKKIDDGYKVFSRQTGAYLYTIDRNASEHVQQDYALTMNQAEQHHPESMYIARKEAEKSQLEYISVACTTGGVYCGGMASKLGKYKELFTAACAGWSGLCVSKIKEMQGDIQKEIDRVKAACGKSDQACFDAITGGQETQARAQSQLEKSTGARPPHTPAGGWAPGRPIKMKDEKTIWYNPACDGCTITEY